MYWMWTRLLTNVKLMCLISYPKLLGIGYWKLMYQVQKWIYTVVKFMLWNSKWLMHGIFKSWLHQMQKTQSVDYKIKFSASGWVENKLIDMHENIRQRLYEWMYLVWKTILVPKMSKELGSLQIKEWIKVYKWLWVSSLRTSECKTRLCKMQKLFLPLGRDMFKRLNNKLHLILN